jgi:hypothetical protein
LADLFSIALIAYELAHQRAGQHGHLSCVEFWLNEGFVTEMAAAWREYRVDRGTTVGDLFASFSIDGFYH